MSDMRLVISSGESATTTVSVAASTTTLKAETTTASSADLSITVTSTVEDETTTEAAETATTTEVSMTLDLSTTLEKVGTVEPTRTAEATSTAASAETATAYASTTTADAFEPIPTFDILAIGAQVDGQKLRGHVTTDYEMGWNLDRTPPILAFSIAPDTNQVKEVNGNSLCLQYCNSNTNHPSFIKLCDACTVTSINNGVAMVTCEQTRDRRLKCSVPAAQCAEDDFTRMIVCSAVSGTFTGFYTYCGMTTGITLVMGPKSNGPTADTFQPVDLGIEPASE
ncbi:uncharacterized protein BKA55DRAFT_546575 [Fusarium redolens]|uniref:Uncharacterized protein n=1 Tax=Fusarium redolens TaxID=48865 RepID=A0A9P9JKX6_FUSRE|nr:uncharacterized protein BKA55DRAFT_546575 [Fusarium redolens]KAH7213353.1 hypothetical protein BKA55DRAFT_546575 [Fusarium redolens]